MAGAPSTSTLSTVYPKLLVTVKVWLVPYGTLTSPDGLIVPPVPAEAVIVSGGSVVKFAVTVLSPFIIMVAGFAEPVRPSDQPLKE